MLRGLRGLRGLNNSYTPRKRRHRLFPDGDEVYAYNELVRDALIVRSSVSRERVCR
jgi:hypothetical protein